MASSVDLIQIKNIRKMNEFIQNYAPLLNAIPTLNVELTSATLCERQYEIPSIQGTVNGRPVSICAAAIGFIYKTDGVAHRLSEDELALSLKLTVKSMME